MLLNALHLSVSYLYFWLAGYTLMSLWPGNQPIPAKHVILPLTGFLVHLPLLSVISLFTPINTLVLLVLTILFFISLAAKKNIFTFSGLNRNNFQISDFSFQSLLLVAFLFILASIPRSLPDMWGYHLQSIQWIEKNPVIPGLGNLCPKFSFNFGTFLPISLLSFRNIIGQPLITINGFLLLILIFLLGFLYKRAHSTSLILLVFLGVFSVLHFFIPVISSSSVDCSAALLLMILFILLITREYDETIKNNTPLNWLILLLIILLPVIKLSNIPLILLVIPILPGIRLKPLRVLLVMMLICYIPWISRNLILTGYLFYPFPFIDVFHVDWKIPGTIALQDYHWIRSWARVPFINPSQVLNKPWMSNWALHTGFFTWFFLTTGFVSTLILFIIKKFRELMNRNMFYLMVINLMTIIFWFIMAPDPRFLITSLVIFPLVPLTMISKGLSCSLTDQSKKLITGILCILFIVFETVTHKNITKVPLIKPEKFPQTEMKTVSIKWLTVHLPESGVNSYDAPIPASPSIIQGFEPRGNTLKEGFRIIELPSIPSIQINNNTRNEYRN